MNELEAVTYVTVERIVMDIQFQGTSRTSRTTEVCYYVSKNNTVARPPENIHCTTPSGQRHTLQVLQSLSISSSTSLSKPHFLMTSPINRSYLPRSFEIFFNQDILIILRQHYVARAPSFFLQLEIIVQLTAIEQSWPYTTLQES